MSVISLPQKLSAKTLPKTYPWKAKKAPGVTSNNGLDSLPSSLRSTARETLINTNKENAHPPRTTMGPEAWSYCRVLWGDSFDERGTTV